MSILDHFHYSTFDIRKDAKTLIKRPGHSYGHLAAIQHNIECENCGKTHEVWAILLLSTGTYMWPGPMFRNLDNAAAYIYDIAKLDDWSLPTNEKLHKHAPKLLFYLVKNNGFPISIDGGDALDVHRDLGLNGYSKGLH